jgi:hypothetical protein
MNGCRGGTLPNSIVPSQYPHCEGLVNVRILILSAFGPSNVYGPLAGVVHAGNAATILLYTSPSGGVPVSPVMVIVPLLLLVAAIGVCGVPFLSKVIV